MPLYVLNNVFCLDLAFEPAQRVFQRLALLQSDFCQWCFPPCIKLTLRRAICGVLSLLFPMACVPPAKKAADQRFVANKRGWFPNPGVWL